MFVDAGRGLLRVGCATSRVTCSPHVWTHHFSQKLASWEFVAAEDLSPAALLGKAVVAITITLQAQIKRVKWHRKGDYIATVCPAASNAHVLIHQVRHVIPLPMPMNARDAMLSTRANPFSPTVV